MPFIARPAGGVRWRWRSPRSCRSPSQPSTMAGEPAPGRDARPRLPGRGGAARRRRERARPHPSSASTDPISQTLDQTGGCLDYFEGEPPTECVFGDTAHPALTVALVGNCAAGQWFDSLNAITKLWHQALEAGDRTALKLSLVIDPGAQLERHGDLAASSNLGRGRAA